MEFDIAAKAKELAVEDAGVVVHITDATGRPAYIGGTDVTNEDGTVTNVGGTPLTWTVCGMNSKQWRQAETWQRKELRKFRGRDLTTEEYTKHQAEFIARCSRGFSGFSNEGQSFPFTTENATLILTNLPYILRQLQAVMGDHESFTKPASIT